MALAFRTDVTAEYTMESLYALPNGTSFLVFQKAGKFTLYFSKDGGYTVTQNDGGRKVRMVWCCEAVLQTINKAISRRDGYALVKRV